jgi:hypothetical protein
MIPEEIKTLVDFAMGDGYIEQRERRRNARMRIEHAQAQQAYAEHKEGILRSLGFKMNAKLITVLNGKNAGKSYYRIDLNQNPLITTAYKWVYNKGRKAIDKALIRQLDDRSLAYWFMDDGYAKLVKYVQEPSFRYYYDVPKVGAFKFANQAFTYEENILFVDWLLGAFGINARIINEKGYEVIISRIEDKEKFVNVIKPYIIPSMMYKIQYPLTFSGIGFTIVQRERTERIDM